MPCGMPFFRPGSNKYEPPGFGKGAGKKQRGKMKAIHTLSATFGCLAILAANAKEAVVHLNEDFEKQPLGILRERSPVRRAVQVSVVDGGGSGQGFPGRHPEWKGKVRTRLESFFQGLELLPANMATQGR
jgi:hypothetical protein